jgi:hypothetical protein
LFSFHSSSSSKVNAYGISVNVASSKVEKEVDRSICLLSWVCNFVDTDAATGSLIIAFDLAVTVFFICSFTFFEDEDGGFVTFFFGFFIIRLLLTFVVAFNSDVTFDFGKDFDFTLDCDEVPVLVLFFCVFFLFSITATVYFVIFFGVDDFDFDYGGLLRLRFRIPLLLQFFFVEVISGMAVKSAIIVSSDDPSSWSSFFSSHKHSE